MPLRSVVIGASAGLGRALAEELAKAGHDLFLVAKDTRDLEALSADLHIRYKRNIGIHPVDITEVPASILVESCVSQIGDPDCLFLVSGQSDLERDFQELSENEAERLADVNFTAPVRIALAFLPYLTKSKNAALVGIGTVAQSRPRAQNTVYAASKHGLEFFFGGLLQKLTWSSCRVQFYRVGFMATQMTFGRKSVVPNTDPAYVARKIVAGLRRDRIGIYLPRWWGLIMMIYRLMPWFIFRKFKR
jgi:short-subunit dehydrogenase